MPDYRCGAGESEIAGEPHGLASPGQSGEGSRAQASGWAKKASHPRSDRKRDQRGCPRQAERSQAGTQHHPLNIWIAASLELDRFMKCFVLTIAVVLLTGPI